jgi:hypothetical protein
MVGGSIGEWSTSSPTALAVWSRSSDGGVAAVKQDSSLGRRQGHLRRRGTRRRITLGGQAPGRLAPLAIPGRCGSCYAYLGVIVVTPRQWSSWARACRFASAVTRA